MLRTGMMMAGIAAGIFAAQAATACDLRALPFGKPTEEVMEEYKLDDVSSGPRATADIRASTLCKGLPSEAVMRFVFLKGTLAKVNIHSNSGKGELLKLAKDTYGDGKTRPRPGLEAEKKPHDFRVSWAADNSPVAVYTSRVKPDGSSREFLAVESRTHGDALEEISRDEEGVK